MCRPNALGGRRCPSDTDPIKRAEKNAKRRAKYAAAKGGKNKGEAGNESSERMTKVSLLTETMTAEETLQSQQETVSEPASYDVDPRRRLGIKVSYDPTADPTRFQPEIVSGRINYNELDEDSHKVFGFTTFDPVKEWANHKNHYDFPDHYKVQEHASLRETEVLTLQEKNVARLYTSSTYEWLNANAYLPEDIPLYSPYEPALGEKVNAEDALNKSFTVREPGQHIETLDMVTKTLDQALSKGPKKQRILYRGVGGSEVQGSADEWVAKNRSIGSEVVFSGYMSTSMSRGVTNMFNGNSMGAYYEILTPEGMSIVGVSSLASEQEVLLPRNQRYIVVGHQKDNDGANIIQMVAINSKGEVLDGTNADPIEPLVTDKMVEQSKKTKNLATWRNKIDEYVENYYPQGDFESKGEALRDRAFVKKMAKRAKDNLIQQLEESSKTGAAEYVQFLKSVADDDDPYSLWEDIKSAS